MSTNQEGIVHSALAIVLAYLIIIILNKCLIKTVQDPLSGRITHYIGPEGYQI